MAKEILDTGTVANDNTGDTLRQGGSKINQNFSEIYSKIGDGTNITFDVHTLSLDTLNDVNLTTPPAVDQYLQFNGSQWVPVTHEVDGAVTGHLIPDANVTYDLGSPTLAFRDLYLSSSSIHLGGLKLSANATTGLVLESNGVPLTPEPIDYDNLANKPTLITSFNELADQPAIPAGDLSTANNAQTLENKTLGSFSPTYIAGNLLPTADVQFDLGSSTNRFRDLYLSSDSLNIGSTKLSTKGGSLSISTVESTSRIIPDNKNSFLPQWSLGNNTDWSGGVANKISVGFGQDSSSQHDTPLVGADGFDGNNWNDDYSYKLVCDLNDPLSIHKEFPILEASSPVAHQGWSVEPNPSLDGSLSTLSSAMGGDTSSHHLDISMRDLGSQSNGDGLFKLTYKFYNPNSPHISEQVSDYIIRIEPGGITTLETTSTTNLFRYWGNIPYQVKFTAYYDDGQVNPNCSMNITPGVDSEWVLSYVDGSWGFTAESDQLEQLVTSSNSYYFPSDSANTLPVFGFTLEAGQQAFLNTDPQNSKNLVFEQSNLNAGYSSRLKGANYHGGSEPMVTIHSLEKDDNDMFYYRIYAMKDEFQSYNLVKDNGNAAYSDPGFLTEFRFSDAFNAGSTLERTSRSRPISTHNLFTNNNSYHQFLIQSDLPGLPSFSNMKIITNYSFLPEIPFDPPQRAESSTHHEQVSWQNIFYGDGQFSVDVAGAGSTVFTLPPLQDYIAQRVSYGSAVRFKVEDVALHHERNDKWMVLNGMKSVSLDKYPFKKIGTPTVEFDGRYVLTARLYDSQLGIDENKPFKEYRCLSKDKYQFDITGGLLHQADDPAEGIVVDTFGNVTFKVRDPKIFSQDMSKCIKLKISLMAQPGLYTYDAYTDDHGYYHFSSSEKPSGVLLLSNTYGVIYTTANTQIGSGADAALIYFNAYDAYFETFKKSEDPTVSQIASTTSDLANTASDVATIQTELAKSLRLTTMAVPTANNAPGTLGDMVVDGNILYICVANDQWGRINLDFNW